jgi:hypothetical protein
VQATFCSIVGQKIPPKIFEQMLELVTEDAAAEGVSDDQFDDLFYMIPAALLFAKHDVDGSGALDKEEARQVLKVLEQHEDHGKMGLRSKIKVSSRPYCDKPACLQCFLVTAVVKSPLYASAVLKKESLAQTWLLC